MRPTLTVTDDPGAAAGRLLREALRAAIADTGRARLAVPGGSSPLPVFRWLAGHLAPATQARLLVTWVDERHVPATDPRSNLRGAVDHWLGRVDPGPTRVPMAAAGTLAEARAAYAADFATRLGGLDAVLLGAGPDGHVASLFPGHPALSATGICVAVYDSPKPPPERLSLTLPVLRDVACSVLVALGAEKAPMLRRAFEGDPDLPLTHTRPRGAWHWVLDPAAAAHLETP